MSRLVDIQTITDGGSNVVTIGTDLALNGSNVALAPDLASTANAEGAALIGVEDSAANFTATTVEGVLAELQTNIDAGVADGLQYASVSMQHDGTLNPSIGTIPVNATITDLRVIVTEVFDGTSPVLSVGNDLDGASALADTDDFDLKTLGVQQKLEWYPNTSGSTIYDADLTPDSSTTGELEVIFFYTQP